MPTHSLVLSRRCLLLSLAVGVHAHGAAAADEKNVQHVDIGGVKIAFSKEIEVSGSCITSDSFDLRFTDALSSLRGLRIDGRANQDDVQFHLVTAKWSEEAAKGLRSLKEDAYYKVRGKIKGARMTGPQKMCVLAVDHFEPMPAAPLTPADFLNRGATFVGIAAPGGQFRIGGETAHLAGVATWPKQVEGKKISVHGIVRGEKGRWQFERPVWSLVELADMVGQEVTLDGSLWSLNGHWWFDYRDERLYLTSEAGPVMTFDDDHGRTARVTGRLARQLRPSLLQISLKTDRDLVPTYVVRGAKVENRDNTTGWGDRFGPILTEGNKVRDGVPELIPGSLRRNLWGNETTTFLYAERNFEAIASIVKEATPATRDVMAQRMDDRNLQEPLQLLYAAILARLNDERGRVRLLAAVQARKEETLQNALFCLGVFPFLAADEKAAVDCAWAEATMLAIMSDRDKAETAVRYSSIPTVLLKINSPQARQKLLEYALNQPAVPDACHGPCMVLRLLCEPGAKLSADDLLQLERVCRNRNSRRSILQALLRLNHPAAATHFLKDLEEESFVYMDMRDHASPVTLGALKPLIPQLKGQARSHAQVLVILGERDPVAALLTLLDDPQFANKSLAMWELERLGDPRAAAPVARILREAPKTYFGNDSELSVSSAVENALDAIASARSRGAVRELIELLSVDLARFGGYIDRAGHQRIAAAHLIELTGESFGVDQASWRAWEQAQPEERFQQPKTAPAKDGFRTDPEGRIDLR